MPDRESFPQQHAGADHIVSFFQKLRLDWLLLHFPPRLVRSVYVFVNGFVTIGVLAVFALVSFPSLEPTAYLLFFTPLGRTSSPRNTVLGHAIGLVCG
jgi:CBS domain-containing membrane protein